MKKSDITIGVVLLGLSAFVFVYGGAAFPAASGNDTGTKFFPFILAGILALLAVLLIVQAVRGHTKTESGFSFPVRSPEMGRVAASCAGCILFIALLHVLGFFLMGAGLLFCMMLMLGGRRYWLMAIAAVAVPAVIQIFFERVLSVMLPYGVLLHLIYR